MESKEQQIIKRIREYYPTWFNGKNDIEAKATFEEDLDILQKAINKIEFNEYELEIYKKAFELSVYKKLYRTLNWGKVPVSNMVKDGLMLIETERLLGLAIEELENGK